MTGFKITHAVDSARPARRAHDVSRLERVLHTIGLDPVLVEAMVGDLAEEYAERRSHTGRSLARLWYIREVARAHQRPGRCPEHHLSAQRGLRAWTRARCRR